MKNIYRKKVLNVICTALVICIAATVLIGCTNDTSKMSTNTLAITENLDYYNEDVKRAEFAEKKDIAFAIDGASDYGIVIGNSANDETMALANELSGYLNRIIGSENAFAVYRDDDSAVPDKFISLGDTRQGEDVAVSELKNDGYLIKNVGQNIFIKTINEQDIGNGVYSFLENHLECMFVRNDYDYVPNFPTIYLNDIDVVSNPYFSWRKIHQNEVAQDGWFKKLKNNGSMAGEVEAIRDFGTFCHSYFEFVDPKIYLESNPDYFSIVDGEPKQLCLTHPDIYPIIEAKMEEKIKEKPEPKYWDFSLIDNRDYCKCARCKKVLKETGSMMGTTLPILNKLARKFPDKIISTLAYYDNEKVPKGMECEDNVNIVIAPIETGQLYSYKWGESKKANRAKEVIEEWGKVAKNIFIWDYVTDFRHMAMPFPNFDVQKDNHEFYKENNVTAVFHQGSREPNHELACLRPYVMANQLWDNDIDINKLMAKYLVVTYGKAAENVAKYLDKCNSELKEKANDLDLYDKPSWHYNDYLSSENTEYYMELINEGIELERDNADIVHYLEEIKINVLYAIMNDGSFDFKRKEQAFDEFIPLVREHKVPQPYEAKIPTMEDYINDVYPEYLVTRKIALAAIIISPILFVAGAGVVTHLVIKRRKKKKTQV